MSRQNVNIWHSSPASELSTFTVNRSELLCMPYLSRGWGILMILRSKRPFQGWVDVRLPQEPGFLCAVSLKGKREVHVRTRRFAGPSCEAVPPAGGRAEAFNNRFPNVTFRFPRMPQTPVAQELNHLSKFS